MLASTPSSILVRKTNDSEAERKKQQSRGMKNIPLSAEGVLLGQSGVGHVGSITHSSLSKSLHLRFLHMHFYTQSQWPQVKTNQFISLSVCVFHQPSAGVFWKGGKNRGMGGQQLIITFSPFGITLNYHSQWLKSSFFADLMEQSGSLMLS